MGDNLRKVQSGEQLKIPAEAYNAFIDAVREERARRHSIEQEAGLEVRQTGIITVRNQSGTDQDRYHILALRNPIVNPTDNLQEFKNRVSLDGVTAVDPAKCERFAILLDPLASGGIGRGIISGVAQVRINVIRESDTYAEILVSDTRANRLSQTPMSEIN